MNILFISPGTQDYQCDVLLHGLRSISAVKVTDVEKFDGLYKPLTEEARSLIYGKGFSLYGLLDDDPELSRANLRRRISNREFSLVVFGNANRSLNYLPEVLRNYKPEEIAFIDGEDHQYVRAGLVGAGVYFKRELCEVSYREIDPSRAEWLKPINFGIPLEKIQNETPPKSRVLANITPLDRTTYVYSTEQDYYADYAASMFGITTRKAGWDCLRHYEIMANGCVPYFIDLGGCPRDTLTSLPKSLLLEMNQLILHQGLDFFAQPEARETWARFQSQIHQHLLAHLTTKAIAQGVLEVCASMRSTEDHRQHASKSALRLTRIDRLKRIKEEAKKAIFQTTSLRPARQANNSPFRPEVP